MESTPFLTIILIVSYSEELPAAKQTEIENDVVRRPAINIGILCLYRENVLSLARAQEKVEIIMCRMITVSHSPQSQALGDPRFFYGWERCTAMIHHKGFQTSHRLFQIRVIGCPQFRRQCTVTNYRMRITVLHKVCIFCFFAHQISFADRHKTLFIFVAAIKLCSQCIFI